MKNFVTDLILPVGLTVLAGLAPSCGSSNSAENSSAAAPNLPSTRQASPLPLGPSFRAISQNIFTPKCVSCHNGRNPSGNTDLTSYDSLVHNTRHTDLVTPGKPDESHLYEVLHNGEMPPSGPQLSEEEIQAISTWISNGAQNN